MNIRARLLAFLLALAVAAAQAVSEAGTDLGLGEVVRALQGWLDGTRDLECRFEQTLVSQALGSDRPERGTMILLRPGRMRWAYEKPEPKLAILEGDRTTVYLPADRQVLRGKLTEENGGALHELLAGSGRIEELFVATLVAAPGKGADAYRLRLVPRGTKEGFEAVVLDVDPGSFAIRAAQVLDPSGSVLEYRFSGLRRNRGVSESAFHFDPPPGTEIVDAP